MHILINKESIDIAVLKGRIHTILDSDPNVLPIEELVLDFLILMHRPRQHYPEDMCLAASIHPERSYSTLSG